MRVIIWIGAYAMEIPILPMTIYRHAIQAMAIINIDKIIFLIVYLKKVAYATVLPLT